MAQEQQDLSLSNIFRIGPIFLCPRKKTQKTKNLKKNPWKKLKYRIHTFPMLNKQCIFTDFSFLWEILQSLFCMGGGTVQRHIHPIQSTWMFLFFFLNHWKIKLQERNFMKAFYHFYHFSETFLRTQPCLTLCQSGTSVPLQLSHQYDIKGQIFKLITAFKPSLSFKLCKYFPFVSCLYFSDKSLS